MTHFPVIIRWGVFELPAHQFFESLAFIAGFQYFRALRSRAKDFLTEQDRFFLLAGAAVGALIFSKFLGAMSTPGLAGPGSLTGKIVFSGQSIIGALLGGIAGVEIIKKRLGINRPTGDIFTYPLILAIMIGRVGCFLTGVYDGTHGLPSHLPRAMDLGDGVPRHPAQLYEIFFLGILWLVLSRIENHLKPGYLFKVFMTAYLAYRLWSETIKPVPPLAWGLSAIQLTCLGGLIYYYRIWIFWKESIEKGKE